MSALSFRWRLALWHMAIVAAILAVTGVAADWALSRTVRGMVDGELITLAETEAGLSRSEPERPITIHELAPGTARPPFIRLDKFVQVVSLDGHVVAASATLGAARLPTPAAMMDRVRAGETVFETLDHFGEEPVRVVALPVDIGTTRYAVQVAASLDDANTVIRAARTVFLTVGVAILAAIGTTGVLLSRKALRPMDEIVRRARRIEGASLTERLPHPGANDEIGRLVDTLNEMLGRIASSMEVQRRFTTDASHELRSPLSRLRAELELTLRRPRDVAEYEETLRSCLEEVERLSRITEELLVLARLDAGEGRDRPAHPVRLAPIVEEAVRRHAVHAERRGVKVSVDGVPDIAVMVLPGVASLALGNILENAVKFSPPGGEVTVRGTAEGHEATLAIADHGRGIPAPEVPQVFDRFYRGSAARESEVPGFGLGLAISRTLVEAQGGHISVTPTPGGGATFRVSLPLAVEPVR
jgi:two-component system, OmpR family, sensor kinase